MLYGNVIFLLKTHWFMLSMLFPPENKYLLKYIKKTKKYLKCYHGYLDGAIIYL